MRKHITLALVLGIISVLAGVPTLTVAAGLNDTGITNCSNATENGLSCPVDGFPRQDAEVGRDAAAGTLTKIGAGEAGFDFTKLDANGNELPASATNHSCVRDNVTGLIWQVKLSDLTYTFDGATDYATSVNSAGLCGFNDWRMPTVKELMSIVHHGRGNPAIYTAYFLNTPSASFWSGSPNACNSNDAWSVYFSNGYADSKYRNYNFHVRLVRGGQSFDTFIDNGDNTVTQVNTDLMWAKCSEGQTGANCSGPASRMNWSEALTAANNSHLGGYSDWRLPNFKELQALANYSLYSPAIDTAYFPNMPGDGFWSGSPHAGQANIAWGVNFNDGVTEGYGRDGNYLVRLVRVGQSFDTFALSVNTAGSGKGIITSSDGVINCGANCSADVNSGSKITLTASADANSVFAGWSGACTNTAGDCTVTMSKAQTVTATFNAAPVNYSLAVSKTGTGTVTSSDGAINCGSGAGCTAKFTSGSTVVLTATPDSGYQFSGWSGACTNKTGNCSVTMTNTKNVTATFTIKTVNYQLTVKTVGNGTVNSDDGLIDCGSDCTDKYASGASITLTAKPTSGHTFVSWTGCTASATNQLQCQFTLTANKTVTATFAVIPSGDNTLTVKVNGNGTVTSTPTGINCGTDCSEQYNSSTQILLTAKPMTGATFNGWSGGGCSGTHTTCLVKMTTAQTVTAKFTTANYTLTVIKTGNGTVFSDTVGIDCGDDCNEGYTAGTVVTLAAAANDGDRFIAWDGCIPIIDTPKQCRVTLNDNATVTAQFSAPVIDVRVVSIALNPATPTVNKAFTATIVIKNIGTVPVNAGNMELWLDNATYQRCKAAGDTMAAIGTLAAGASKTITAKNLKVATAGSKRLHVFADSQCVTAELHEGNNQAIKRYQVK